MKLVNLGDRCALTLVLNTNGMREASYPFDWIVTNLSLTKEILKTNFETFLTDPMTLPKSLGHRVFYHHNPLTEGEYFQRCVDRFMALRGEAGVRFMMSISQFGDSVSSLHPGRYSVEEFDELLAILKEFGMLDPKLSVFYLLSPEDEMGNPREWKTLYDMPHLQIFEGSLNLKGGVPTNDAKERFINFFEHDVLK